MVNPARIAARHRWAKLPDKARQKVIDLLVEAKGKPLPDKEVHALADELGMSAHALESEIYAFASLWAVNENARVNPGGRAEQKGVTRGDFPKALVEQGIKVELEHTDDRELAEKIVLDHLAEDQGYYDALAKMEKGLEKDASTRQAFKVSPDIVDAGRRAWDAAKEIETRSHTLSQLMQSIVGSLRWEIHRAKRKGGDVRNLAAVLKELEDYDKDIQRACTTIDNLGLSMTMGAAMSDLALEMPDTPSLRVVK